MPSTGAYVYNERAALAFDAMQDVSVADGDAVEVALLNMEFPGGIQTENNFFTSYEGAVTFDADKNDGFLFALSVAHVFSDGTTLRSRPRIWTERVNRNTVHTIQLAAFNSISVVPAGDYDHLLAEPVQIEVDLAVSRDGGGAWNLDNMALAGGRVTFYQLNDGRAPAFDAPTVSNTGSLKDRIDASLRASGWTVTTWANPTVRNTPTTVATRFTGFALRRERIVPQVQCALTLAVNTRTRVEEVDIEGLTDDLLSLLGQIPDCYPLQTSVTVTYEERYIAALVTCVGV